MCEAEGVGKEQLPCTCQAAVEVGQQVFLGATVHSSAWMLGDLRQGFCYPRDGNEARRNDERQHSVPEHPPLCSGVLGKEPGA